MSVSDTAPNLADGYVAPAGTSIGHIHLRVADLERAVAFYSGVLGFVVQSRNDQAAFLSAPMAPGPDGGSEHYHHHIALNTWASFGGAPPPAGHTGLYHAAILYPDRASLGQAVARVLAFGVTLTGASDHGVSEAVYLNDPDGNGLELYRDRPPSAWPRDGEGRLAMTRERLDVAALIEEATGQVGATASAS